MSDMKQMIESALSNIKNVADANTVIGTPIIIDDGTTVIPFSKVSVGFASGGSDFGGKEGNAPNFAGGNGAGLTVVPLGFIIASNGDVRVIDLKTPVTLTPPPTDPVNKALDAVNGVIDRAPELINRIKDIIPKKKSGSSDEINDNEDE